MTRVSQRFCQWSFLNQTKTKKTCEMSSSKSMCIHDRWVKCQPMLARIWIPLKWIFTVRSVLDIWIQLISSHIQGGQSIPLHAGRHLLRKYFPSVWAAHKWLEDPEGPQHVLVGRRQLGSRAASGKALHEQVSQVMRANGSDCGSGHSALREAAPDWRWCSWTGTFWWPLSLSNTGTT